MSHVTYPFYFNRSVHIDNQFATLNLQNAQNISLNIYITVSHWVFLHASIHRGSSWGNQTKSTANFRFMWPCIINI